MGSVKARMVVLVASVLVALVTTLGVAEWMSGHVTKRYEATVRGPLAARQVASELETHVARYGALLMTHIAEHDPARSGRLEAGLEAEHSAIAALLDRVNADRDLRAAFNGRTERIRDQVAAFKTAATPALAASRADKAREALTLYEQQVAPARELLSATLSEMDADLAQKAEDAVAAVGQLVRSATAVKYVVAAVGVTVVLTIGLLVTRSLLRSTRELERVSGSIAAGDLTVRFVTSGDDELNRAGTQLNEAVNALSAMIAEVADTCVTLSRTAESLGGMAEDLDARAKETDDRAGAASAGGEEVSRSVTTLSTGAEEMTASIKEISKNAAEAAEFARTAVGTAQQSKATVARLDQSSKEIGEVLKTITEIAEQTNLLALNATIEAARAGEMGKGFAVVANEVKSLATQTSRATGDIASRINSVRTNTTEAVAAMDRIAEVVGRICEFQNTIASAVEEQTATTNEMSRSIAEAAAGSSDIARNVTGVATSVQAVYAATRALRASVNEVNASAERMRAKVSCFRTADPLPTSTPRAGSPVRLAA